MAHFHVHVRPGPKGKGAEHAQYIAREGRFTPEKYGEIGEKASGNLPEWARGSAARFFAAADEHERMKGNSYREFELALPNELSALEHGRLVRELLVEQIGDAHAYSWAIHEPNGKNPHVHIMFSERIIDGILRGPEHYFKRANTKQPERGGQLKSDRWAGKGGPEAVVALRAHWAEMQNQALERAGVEARVDHRSLKAQGIEREAGQHRGPAVSGVEARGEVAQVTMRREAERVERAQARAAVVAEVRVVTREAMATERVAVRERRELAAEVTGEDRSLVLPLVEADRREQLGRVEAQVERRIERRQGMGVGELKEKLLTQARTLRERIGREIGRVKVWVAERFPEPMAQLKARSRELLGAVTGKGRGALSNPPGTRTEKSRTAQREWDAGQSAAPPPARATMATRAHGEHTHAVPRDETAIERERRATLNAQELQALITRIRPAAVEQLVEREPAVVVARTQAEGHQRTAQQALLTASRATAESHAWRDAHGLQATLHDLGAVKSAYLVERAAACRDAEHARAHAVAASRAALTELARARREAEQRITQETAPARAQVAELRQLLTAAYERERLIEEFEQLARGRAAGRAEYQDTGQDWQATPPKLRQAIEAYNREPAHVQAEILERFSRTAALVESMGEDFKRRREHLREHERERGWDLGL